VLPQKVWWRYLNALKAFKSVKLIKSNQNSQTQKDKHRYSLDGKVAHLVANNNGPTDEGQTFYEHLQQRKKESITTYGKRLDRLIFAGGSQLMLVAVHRGPFKVGAKHFWEKTCAFANTNKTNKQRFLNVAYCMADKHPTLKFHNIKLIEYNHLGLSDLIDLVKNCGQIKSISNDMKQLIQKRATTF
jgi:hypothetical protein